MKFRISEHAQSELNRRGIPLSALEAVLQNPQQMVPTNENRVIYQSMVDSSDGKQFLLRAIVDPRYEPFLVVTAYRTTKIKKYWRTS